MEDSLDLGLNHTTKGWPFDRGSIGLPVKPPQGACFSWVGTERCGKGRDLFMGLCRVGHKEMKEMRLNHCRGVVTNLVDSQNRKDLRPEGNGSRNVNLSCILIRPAWSIVTGKAEARKGRSRASSLTFLGIHSVPEN